MILLCMSLYSQCNYQACKQLNAWLAGYESILKRMTPSNFNWFLHTMLFYHTQRIIDKQTGDEEEVEDDDESESDEQMVVI